METKTNTQIIECIYESIQQPASPDRPEHEAVICYSPKSYLTVESIILDSPASPRSTNSDFTARSIAISQIFQEPDVSDPHIKINVSDHHIQIIQELEEISARHIKNPQEQKQSPDKPLETFFLWFEKSCCTIPQKTSKSIRLEKYIMCKTKHKTKR